MARKSRYPVNVRLAQSYHRGSMSAPAHGTRKMLAQPEQVLTVCCLDAALSNICLHWDVSRVHDQPPWLNHVTMTNAFRLHCLKHSLH